jgi:hypothetical protein
MKTTTEKQAREDGYRAVTSDYYLPRESTMLDHVIKDMKSGRIDYVLVKRTYQIEGRTQEGISVWRKRYQYGREHDESVSERPKIRES